MKFFKLSILLFIISLQAHANYCGKWFDNFNSPVCTDAKYIFWTGTLITASFYLFKDSFVEPLQERTITKDHLRGDWGEAFSRIGDGYLNGAYILWNFIKGGKLNRIKAEHMLEATFYTVAVTQGLKHLVHETRPGDPADHNSFPSGHASAAFAFASVVTAQDGIIAGAGAHILASLIAFSRMDENRHYLHDIIFGATIGMSYGWGIYMNHTKFRKPFWFAMTPSPDLKGASFSIAYKF